MHKQEREVHAGSVGAARTALPSHGSSAPQGATNIPEWLTPPGTGTKQATSHEASCHILRSGFTCTLSHSEEI